MLEVTMLLLALTAACMDVGPGGQPGGRVARERTQPVAGPAPAAPSRPEELVEVVHRQINAHRESLGLDELELDGDVSRIATDHSRGMATGRVPFGHAGFEGRARAVRSEVVYGRLAENVGYNRGVADAAADAVERWLRSPAHRANVTGDFEITGIGVAVNERGEYYFTQIFVKPF